MDAKQNSHESAHGHGAHTPAHGASHGQEPGGHGHGGHGQHEDAPENPAVAGLINLIQAVGLVALFAALIFLKLPGDPHGPVEEHHGDPSAMEHVLDDQHGSWHLFMALNPKHIHLPKIFNRQITKFMVLELIAGLLVLAIYIPIGRRAAKGAPPRGAWDNAFECLLTFVRNEVAKPNLGEKDADKHVPFLWTLFLFVLFNNLLGLLPFGGSATASIYVTAGLAFCVFLAIHISASRKMGVASYVGSMWPHIDVPFPMGLVIKPVVFAIELVGVVVRNVVLAVRLFANMFAGHMVLATILIFIFDARNANGAIWGMVTFSSVGGIVVLSMLELFVAFLQAYIFTFLTSLFMGMALHPQH